MPKPESPLSVSWPTTLLDTQNASTPRLLGIFEETHRKLLQRVLQEDTDQARHLGTDHPWRYSLRVLVRGDA